MEEERFCPECGMKMEPYVESKFGYMYILWICHCGHSEKEESTGFNMKDACTEKNETIGERWFYA